MRLDEERFLRQLEALGRIGTGPGGGLDRLAYTPADLEARRWIESRMRQMGLAIRTDPVGNTIATYPGLEPNRPSLCLGSHTDTVPNGGRYDGALGVVASLACIRALWEADIHLRHPVEVINFAAEEGTMSGVTFGSRAMAGSLDPGAVDRPAYDGRPVREHLQAAGLDPERIVDAKRAQGSLAAYLELHIEQGGTLEAEEMPIGIVEGIAGIRRYSVSFRGVANHSGTTPMHRRRDALVRAAPFVETVRDLALAHGILGTVGVLKVDPGAPNVIPRRVELTVETRALDEEVLDRVEAELEGRAREAGADFAPVSSEPSAASNPRLMEVLKAACGELGSPYLRMPSGAGHDAMAMASIAPVAMVFVPSRGGVSHTPDEFTDPQSCVRGAKVLLTALTRLDSVLVTDSS